MRKLDNKGIGHHLLLIAIAVVAVIGAAGYFVWQRQQDNDIDASAAGFTFLNKDSQVAVYACKNLTSTIDADKWRVKLRAYKVGKPYSFRGVIFKGDSMGDILASKSVLFGSSNYRDVDLYFTGSNSLIAYTYGLTEQTGVMGTYHTLSSIKSTC